MSRRIGFSLLVVCITALAGVAAAQSHQPVLPEQTPHLVILSAQPDAANLLLHVAGRNFCAFPQVAIGGTPVTIAGGATESSFDALLPVGIAPGTYLLEVSCGKGAIRNDTFVVTITGPAE